MARAMFFFFLIAVLNYQRLIIWNGENFYEGSAMKVSEDPMDLAW